LCGHIRLEKREREVSNHRATIERTITKENALRLPVHKMTDILSYDKPHHLWEGLEQMTWGVNKHWAAAFLSREV
jgi:hypothetical protein